MCVPRITLDHTLVLLKGKKVLGGPSPFKFEEIWFLHPDFIEIVEFEWKNVVVSGNASQIFALKLKALKKRLIAWNKSSGDSLKANLEVCKEKINELDWLEEECNLLCDERGIRNGLRKAFQLLVLEEIFWKQRARLRWLEEGDQNTIFFS